MIFCHELNKSFDNVGLLHAALKENEKSIIEIKRSKIIETKDNLVKMNQVKTESATKAFNLGSNEVCAIINTTMYMDSHSDVHANGIWEKSIKEQYGRIFYICDHSLDVDKVIVWKDNLAIFTQMVDWSTVGKNYDGQTQALIFKFDKKHIRNDAARKVIEEGLEVENSIRMQYVTIKLAVNSSDEDYKENKVIWDDNIELIANREEVNEKGYFWLIKEAKIINEGSMVLFGSNDATSIVTSNKNIVEPPKGTEQKEDSAASSHESTEEAEQELKRKLQLIY